MGRNVKVILQPVKFRKKSHIALLSPNNSEVDAVIREFNNAEWSTGYRFWHLPVTPSIVKEISTALKGIAVVDASSFKNYKYDRTQEKRPRRKRIKNEKPTQQQQLKLQKFKTVYKLKGYSEGTIKVYVSMLNVFFGWFNKKTDDEITNEDILHFLADYIDKNNLTQNYKRLMTNSLRRYFDFVGKNDLAKF